MTIASEIELVTPVGNQSPELGDEFGAPSKSQGRQAFERFTHSWMSMISLILFVAIIAFCFVYPQFYHWKFQNPDLRAVAQSAKPGHAGHILGTDETGFDLLARMMRGTQRDFIIMIVSTAVTLTIGITIGAIAGYFGAIADNLLMRFVDLMLSVPVLVILIIYCNRTPDIGPVGLALAFGVFGWMGLARLVRAQFLSLKEREFVEAAHAMGASNFRIIVRHMIPNTTGTILVFGTIFAALSIVTETSLTFLGVGVHPPDTSLGLLITNGVDAADTRPWLFYYPGLVVVLIVLIVNLIGEGIRNAFDPRHNRVRD
ncbi:MAG: ABC transporter permease [Actinomycetota bacterium]|nr:ABC transporter permease [Actinomycetota bacterium]